MTANNPYKPIIGLTGPPASGKTTIALQFRDLGCAVISADSLNHGILNCPPVQAQLRSLFGPSVFHDEATINRRALGNIVFNDPERLNQLTDIVHPRIRQKVDQLIHLYKKEETVPAIVLDVPLLCELRWQGLCDVMIVVTAPMGKRLQWARQQRDWDRHKLKTVEQLQWTVEQKKQNADYVIDNDRDLSELTQQVRNIFNAIVEAG